MFLFFWGPYKNRDLTPLYLKGRLSFKAKYGTPRKEGTVKNNLKFLNFFLLQWYRACTGEELLRRYSPADWLRSHAQAQLTELWLAKFAPGIHSVIGDRELQTRSDQLQTKNRERGCRTMFGLTLPAWVFKVCTLLIEQEQIQIVGWPYLHLPSRCILIKAQPLPAATLPWDCRGGCGGGWSQCRRQQKSLYLFLFHVLVTVYFKNPANYRTT